MEAVKRKASEEEIMNIKIASHDEGNYQGPSVTRMIGSQGSTRPKKPRKLSVHSRGSSLADELRDELKFGCIALPHLDKSPVQRFSTAPGMKRKARLTQPSE